jgi:hypothetical protein
MALIPTVPIKEQGSAVELSGENFIRGSVPPLTRLDQGPNLAFRVQVLTIPSGFDQAFIFADLGLDTDMINPGVFDGRFDDVRVITGALPCAPSP